MIEGINTVIHGNFLDNNLPDKCANLIIADPPYFEVKGDFDFVWGSFEDYLKDVEKWAIECKRVLADNGTLYWYGDAKNIAYSQIILDKHFNLLNSLVWENTNDHKQQIRFNTDLRTFAPLTERILMYGSDMHDTTGTEFIKDEYWGEMSPFSKIITDHIENKGFTQKDISLLQLSRNGKPTGWVSNKIKFGQLPTSEQWNLICNLFLIENKYDDLRKEYDDLRRPFNNERHYGDVIRLPNYETSDYDHDTIKPEKLTRILINTCSRKNDLVVVPFAGSGTECAMAIKEGRTCIGYDVEKKYADMSNERIKAFKSQPQLF
jgi:DNA modification methylase